MLAVYLFFDRCRCFFPTGSSGLFLFVVFYPALSLRSNTGLQLANAFGVDELQGCPVSYTVSGELHANAEPFTGAEIINAKGVR